MTDVQRPEAGWLERASAGGWRLAGAVWAGFLGGAAAARLWAKILAVPILTGVLLYLAHMVADRPWARGTEPLRLHILARTIDWTALLALVCTLALAGVALRARRGPAGAEIELAETPADPPGPDARVGAASAVSSPPA